MYIELFGLPKQVAQALAAAEAYGYEQDDETRSAYDDSLLKLREWLSLIEKIQIMPAKPLEISAEDLERGQAKEYSDKLADLARLARLEQPIDNGERGVNSSWKE